MTNPELGQEYIARIFTTLYVQWPKRIGLDAAGITGVVYDTDCIFSTPRIPTPREWDICSETFVWLTDEGYIRTDGCQGNVWTLGRTQLTHKAIEALNKLPDPLNSDKNRSFIDALLATSKDSGKQVRGELIKLGMSGLYTLLQQ